MTRPWLVLVLASLARLLGIYEFLTMLALSVWLPGQSAALGFAAVTHVVSLGLSVVLGLIAAWREGVQLSTLARESLVTTERDVESTCPKPIVLEED